MIGVVAMLFRIILVVGIVSLTGCGLDGNVHRGSKNPLQSGNNSNPGNVIPEAEKKTIFEAVWNELLVYSLKSLPEEGSVSDENVPYSGFWYPNNAGGTGVRVSSDLSALEKYDKVFNGGGNQAQTWEATNHGPSASEVEWAGHCNGWTAASQRQKEPRHTVTKNGIVFEPRDIKALLAEVHMSAKPELLGGHRCNSPQSGSIFSNTDSQCEPINPAVFHVVLANWIGRKSHTVAFDKSSTNQVWNYPIYAYSAKISSMSESEGARLFASGSQGQIKDYVSVYLTVTHADSLGSDGSGESNSFPTRKSKQVVYSYALGLDASGSVVDGVWMNRSETSPPEFVWVAFEPLQNDSHPQLGNPHLNIETVLSLWAESIGENPGSAPRDIQSPCWPLSQCIKE